MKQVHKFDTVLHEVITILCMYIAPTAAPKYFRVINVTSTSITFQWDHLITGVNGLITKYVITCKNQTGNSFVVGHFYALKLPYM